MAAQLPARRAATIHRPAARGEAAPKRAKRGRPPAKAAANLKIAGGQLQPLVRQRPRSASSAKTARSVTRAIDPEAPQAGSGKAAVHLTARRRVPLRGARFELRNGGACSDGRGGAGPCKANQVDLPRSHGAALPRGRRGWDEAQPLDRTLLRVEQAARCITDGGSAGGHSADCAAEPPPPPPDTTTGRWSRAVPGQLQPLVGLRAKRRRGEHGVAADGP